MYSSGSPVKTCLAVGGMSIGQQLSQLERGCDILAATPGRLKDIFQRGRLSFSNTKLLVLDEADTMLDMGFEPQIRHIVEQCDMTPKKSRHTMMFSATFPEDIQHLAHDFLNEEVFIRTGVTATTELISQRVEFAKTHGEKLGKLKEVLKSLSTTDTVLIFVNEKIDVDAIVSNLSTASYKVSGIHGDMTQSARQNSLDSFKSKGTQILVATNVAARGLNIPKISMVVNLDFPQNFEDYIHRIGRTGRAGTTGIAVTFLTNEDAPKARKLIKIMMETNQQIPEWLKNMSNTSHGDEGFGRYGQRQPFRRDRDRDNRDNRDNRSNRSFSKKW